MIGKTSIQSGWSMTASLNNLDITIKRLQEEFVELKKAYFKSCDEQDARKGELIELIKKSMHPTDPLLKELITRISEL